MKSLNDHACVSAGFGVPVRRLGGEIVQSRGRALWFAAAPWQRLRVGPHFSAGMEIRAAARRPSPGAGEGSTWRSLACMWLETIYLAWKCVLCISGVNASVCEKSFAFKVAYVGTVKCFKCFTFPCYPHITKENAMTTSTQRQESFCFSMNAKTHLLRGRYANSFCLLCQLQTWNRMWHNMWPKSLTTFSCLQAMEGSMLTLSLANWMELPGLKLKDWIRDKRRSVHDEAIKLG